jgi:flagellar protein FlbD
MGLRPTPQGWLVVIIVTRFNGPEFALNPDLIERADHTPDTVITLVDGTKYVIAESIAEFVEIVRLYRASIIAAAQEMTSPADPRRPGNPRPKSDTAAKVVPLHRRGEH